MVDVNDDGLVAHDAPPDGRDSQRTARRGGQSSVTFALGATGFTEFDLHQTCRARQGKNLRQALRRHDF
jgi:hypothetical protein